MKAYVISMPQRADRRAHMASLLASAGMEFEFVDPVPVEEVPPGYGSDMTRGNLSLNRTIAERILPLAERSPAPDADGGGILVLEDDLMVAAAGGDPASVLPAIRAALADLDGHVGRGQWDALYLEYCFETCRSTVRVTDRVSRASRPYCTAAMVYSREGIRRAVECVREEKRMLGFSYARCVADGRLRAYVCTPPLFAQDAAFEGDLGHEDSPLRLHWWLNLLVRMYPRDGEHAPRLPACSSGVLAYVRWGRIAAALALGAAAMLATLLVERWLVSARRGQQSS